MDTQTEAGTERVIVRPTIADSTEQEAKKVIRRKRFDPILQRYVTPEERDIIQAFQERHKTTEYPPKFAGELEALEVKEQAEAKAKAASKASKQPKVTSIAPSQAIPLEAQDNLLKARARASEVMSDMGLELAKIPTDTYAKLLVAMERKFLQVYSR